jgi:Zinc-binding
MWLSPYLKLYENSSSRVTYRRKDANAFMCELCRMTFMVNARPPLLWQHVVAKHPDTDPLACFPVHMQGFDPNDPKGEKKAAEASVAAVAVKPKKIVKKDDALDSLLDAGLKKKK